MIENEESNEEMKRFKSWYLDLLAGLKEIMEKDGLVEKTKKLGLSTEPVIYDEEDTEFYAKVDLIDKIVSEIGDET